MKLIRCTTTLDLYAGIGGMRLGFEKSSFKTVFANDNDIYAKHIYDANFCDTKLTIADVKLINPKKLPDFDILLAGFPC